jgi:hypothetical protein
MKDHRTESQRGTDEPWTLYTEIKRDRNRLRAWLRWLDTRLVGVADWHPSLRAALHGKPAPRARRAK